MTRPFRFGVVAGATGDGAAWTATARRVEAAGFDTLLLPDTTSGPSPLIALATAAAATSVLRVGTWVLCGPLHTATRLVRDARTMQELFGQRFELGLGAGRPGAERDAELLGLAYGSPGVRVAELESTVAQLREQLPDLAVLVAASGPRLSGIAAAVADVVALGWPPHTDDAAAAAAVSRIRRDDADPELASGLVAVNDSPAPWLRHAGTSAEELAAQGAVTVLTGSTRAMADELSRRRERLGVSYWTIPESALEQFTPVLELLAGA